MDARGRDVLLAVSRSTTDGLVVLGLDGRVTWANPAFARMVGVPEDAVVGVDLRDHVGRAVRRRWPEHLERMSAGHPGRENREILLVRPDGSRTWTLASWGPLPPDEGPGRYWGRATEYTERKQLLAALTDREHQLAASQELARLGSWTWRVGSQEMAWSPTLFRLLGLDPGEFTPTLVGTLDFLVEGRDQVERDLAGPLEPGRRLTWQWRVRRVDGTELAVRALGEVVGGDSADGGAPEVRGTVQDVTAMVQTTAEADEARRRLLLLQGVAEAANGATTLAAALEAAGLVLGRHSSWRPCAVFVLDGEDVTDESGGPDLRALERTPEQTATLPGPDHDLARRAWRTRTVQTVVVPTDPGRTTVAVPILLEDVTCCVVQLVVAEAPVAAGALRLVAQVAELLASVAQRERDAHSLAQARDQAERASRTKSDFLATMSHEIRTPMNGVIGLTELLLRTSLDDQQRTLAEALRGTGRTLLSLINDVLDLSRIESGHLDLDSTEFEVRSVVEHAVAVVAAQA